MKKILVMLLVVISIKSFGQDSLRVEVLHNQIFSLAPISKNVDKVNGLCFGLGHIENKKIKNQTINGLNVEANPAPIAGALFAFMSIIYLPDIIKNNSRKKDSIYTPNFKIKNWEQSPNLKINGINISTGCFFVPTSMNGINISVGNEFKNFNGVSIAPLGTISDKFNGLSIGIINANSYLNGASFGLYNQTYELKGLQFGIVNRVQISSGIQIGIYNKSYARGLQIGIWNKNSKHSFPILNW